MRPLSRSLTRLLQAPIVVYRWTLSPFLPQTCRFLPTCSAYALEALELHGPWRGGLLALRRLLRCHPIHWLGGRHGFDPVPPRGATFRGLARGRRFRHTQQPGTQRHAGREQAS